MTLSRAAPVAFLWVLAVSSVAIAQECDCARWPWPDSCDPICELTVRQRLSSAANSVDDIVEAVELIYQTSLPTRGDRASVVGTLYDNPLELGWVDVSEFPKRAGAVVMWPSMSGVVVADAGGTVLVLYPELESEGGYLSAPVGAVGDGSEPRYVVPLSNLSSEGQELLESTR